MTQLLQILNFFKRRGQTLSAVLRPDPMVRVPIAISFGAMAGALSRYYLTLGFNEWFGTAFPFGTGFINGSGAFMMGFFATLAIERTLISPDLRLAIAVGFLGSYTTFSSYELDSEKLLTTETWDITSLYWIGSAILGVLCLEVGTYLARRWP